MIRRLSKSSNTINRWEKEPNDIMVLSTLRFSLINEPFYKGWSMKGRNWLSGPEGLKELYFDAAITKKSVKIRYFLMNLFLLDRKLLEIESKKFEFCWWHHQILCN